MAKIVTLPEAVADLVRDGDAIALEGFTHLIPFAAGHEVLRQGRTELELIRMTPDILYDQMVGMGAARKLVFSYAGNPGVGSLHRLRDAIEHGWPRPIEIDEHSHAGMANRYLAGASDLPFAVLRGYRGTDLAATCSTRVAWISCPFTGAEVAAVPALRPKVAIVHAQEADRRGPESFRAYPWAHDRAAAARTGADVARPFVHRPEPAFAAGGRADQRRRIRNRLVRQRGGAGGLPQHRAGVERQQPARAVGPAADRRPFVRLQPEADC